MSRRVIVNATPLLSELTGIGNYTNQIVNYLSQQKELSLELYPSFAQIYRPGEAHEHRKDRKAHFLASAKSIIGSSTILRRIAQLAMSSASKVDSQKYDVYFEPNFIPNLSCKSEKVVATVHDFSFAQYPQWSPKPRLNIFSKEFWPAIQRADRIVTVSKYVKKQAITQYGFDESKIEVIQNGVDHSVFRYLSPQEKKEFRKKHKDIPENYILFTGSMEPRKNITTLIKSFSLLPQSIREAFKLVLVGGKGWVTSEIKHLLKKHSDNILFLGYVDQPTLVGLYNCASCFVYIPWYEGFGLPPLEAMACGCPCVVSKVSSLPEVCGDAVSYVSPSDPVGTAAQINSLLESELARDRHKAAGLRQSKNFSWSISCQKHAELLLNI